MDFKREIKKAIPGTIAPKIIKYLGINLTKEVSENHKTLMKETHYDSEKWKDIPCS